MSYYIKRTDVSGSFWGPFTVEEIHERLADGRLSWDNEAIEAAGQTLGQLRASSNWCRLSDVSELDREVVARSAVTVSGQPAAILQQVRNWTCYASTRRLIESVTTASMGVIAMTALYLAMGSVLAASLNLFFWTMVFAAMASAFAILTKQMLFVIVDIADVLMRQTHERKNVSNN